MNNIKITQELLNKYYVVDGNSTAKIASIFNCSTKTITNYLNKYKIPIRGSKKLNTENFIHFARLKHNNKYDYSKTNYIDCYQEVSIICINHGLFKQAPYQHIYGTGCPQCNKSHKVPEKGMTLSDKFPEISSEWSSLNLKQACDYKPYSGIKVFWQCKKCAKTWESRIVSRTKHGTGCKSCCSSKGESQIEDFLIKNALDYKKQYVDKKCKNKAPLRFDFAVWINGNLKLIEYNGEQHYKDKNFFKESLEEISKKDKIKEKFCNENHIPLLIIHYKEFNKIAEKLEKFVESN